MTVSVEMLHRLLACDPEAGKLFWKARTPDLFRDGPYVSERQCAAWNGRFSGSPAFTALEASGYLHGRVFGLRAKAHRVVWAMATGEWPRGQIDHLNGNRADNRIVNLRCVDASGNSRNQRLRSDNQSGVPGVYQTPCGTWAARINVDRRYLGLGTYAAFEDAVAARRAAERAHGFHPNHGRLA